MDQMSELMYALFPIFVVITDPYNANTDIQVLLGQLSMSSNFNLFAVGSMLISQDKRGQDDEDRVL